MVIDGSAFVAYVGQCLAPLLKCNEIVVMDNLPAHDLSSRISSRKWLESITRWGMDMKPSRFSEEQIIGILREQEERTRPICAANTGVR